MKCLMKSLLCAIKRASCVYCLHSVPNKRLTAILWNFFLDEKNRLKCFFIASQEGDLVIE